MGKSFLKFFVALSALMMFVGTMTCVSANEARIVYPERETVTNNVTSSGGAGKVKHVATADVYLGLRVEPYQHSATPYNKVALTCP